MYRLIAYMFIKLWSGSMAYHNNKKCVLTFVFWDSWVAHSEFSSTWVLPQKKTHTHNDCSLTTKPTVHKKKQQQRLVHKQQQHQKSNRKILILKRVKIQNNNNVKRPCDLLTYTHKICITEKYVYNVWL